MFYKFNKKGERKGKTIPPWPRHLEGQNLGALSGKGETRSPSLIILSSPFKLLPNIIYTNLVLSFHAISSLIILPNIPLTCREFDLRVSEFDIVSYLKVTKSSNLNKNCRLDLYAYSSSKQRSPWLELGVEIIQWQYCKMYTTTNQEFRGKIQIVKEKLIVNKD